MTLALADRNAPHIDREGAPSANRIWHVLPDLFAIADVGGSLLRINPAWTGLLGWNESELLGREIDWLAHPEDRDRTRTELRRLATESSTRCATGDRAG
jgi:PAS domain S-box-containing protein